ncbi:MAG: hypothetical protein ACTS5A_01315 [Candidatus Hodgkinia cicadicola]
MMFENLIKQGGSVIKDFGTSPSWLRRRICPVELTINELNQTNEHAKTSNDTPFDWKPLPWLIETFTTFSIWLSF